MSTQYCNHCEKMTEHRWKKMLASTTPGCFPGSQVNERFVCDVCDQSPPDEAVRQIVAQYGNTLHVIE